MEMDKKTIMYITIAGLGVVAFVYLKRSGRLDSLFGWNRFTDATKLLEYCRACPDGAATYFDGATEHNHSCQDWLAAQGFAAAPANSGTASDGAMVNNLRARALANPILGADSATVAQWNSLLRELDPEAEVADLSAVGIERGQNDVMDAAQFVTLRAQAGLSGRAPVATRTMGAPATEMLQ